MNSTALRLVEEPYTEVELKSFVRSFKEDGYLQILLQPILARSRAL